MKKHNIHIQKATSETTATTDTENPIQKFYRIKKEIGIIEKDIQFYQKNVKFNKI
jgi:hypothetical protein